MKDLDSNAYELLDCGVHAATISGRKLLLALSFLDCFWA